MKTIYNKSAKLVFLPFLDISPFHSSPQTVCISIFIFILTKSQFYGFLANTRNLGKLFIRIFSQQKYYRENINFSVVKKSIIL